MKRSKYLKFLALVCIIGMLLVPAGCGGSKGSDVENYPNKTITIYVGFNPGGGVDTAVRGIQPFLQKYIGESVLIENKPGNQGLNAMNLVGEAEPDGYSLLATTNAMSLNAMIFPEFYKLDASINEAFQPIYCWSNEDGNGIYVSKDSPYKTFDDLVVAANTGAGVKIGGSGIGSTDHITLIILQKVYGGKWTLVPMDSGGEVASAVLGKKLDAGSSSPSGASIDANSLNMLAVTLKERSAKWPDAPTFLEMGKPELYVPMVLGLMAPAGTPPEIVTKLEDAMEKAFNDPEYRAWVETAKQPIGKDGWGAEAYGKYMEDYQKNMKDMIPIIKAELDVAQGKK